MSKTGVSTRAGTADGQTKGPSSRRVDDDQHLRADPAFNSVLPSEGFRCPVDADRDRHGSKRRAAVTHRVRTGLERIGRTPRRRLRVGRRRRCWRLRRVGPAAAAQEARRRDRYSDRSSLCHEVTAEVNIQIPATRMDALDNSAALVIGNARIPVTRAKRPSARRSMPRRIAWRTGADIVVTIRPAANNTPAAAATQGSGWMMANATAA